MGWRRGTKQKKMPKTIFARLVTLAVSFGTVSIPAHIQYSTIHDVHSDSVVDLGLKRESRMQYLQVK